MYFNISINVDCTHKTCRYKLHSFVIQCCLGMELFYNPNIAGEMPHLLLSNQEKYVPYISLDDCKSVATQIPFHGDQLFEERARHVKWTFQDGDNDLNRLEGLCPEFAD